MDQARETVFISYRWREGRRFAIALGRAFRRKGLSPWLDALSIPAYEAKRDLGVDAPRLEKNDPIRDREVQICSCDQYGNLCKDGMDGDGVQPYPKQGYPLVPSHARGNGVPM